MSTFAIMNISDLILTSKTRRTCKINMDKKENPLDLKKSKQSKRCFS